MTEPAWEPPPDLSPAARLAAAADSERRRAAAMERAWLRWTEQERRERLHHIFIESGYAVQMTGAGVGSTAVQSHAADAVGYLLGFTAEEVQQERAAWRAEHYPEEHTDAA